ncbi:unnamed protein product [Ectocarpus sp. 8 AP-2014]
MPAHEGDEDLRREKRNQAEEQVNTAAGDSGHHEPLVPDGGGAVSGPGLPQGGPQTETVQATAELMIKGGSDGVGCGRSIARRANNKTSDSIEIGNNDNNNNNNNNSDVGTGSGTSPTDWGPQQQQQGDHRQHSLPRETTGQDHGGGGGGGGGGGATRGYLERRSTSTAATREPTVTMSPVEPFHMAALGGHQHVGMMTMQDGRHVGRDTAGSGNVYRVGGASRGGSGTGGGGGGVEGSRRGLVPAPKRRRPPSTATATYTWGVEPRKGGVREKLTATIDAADMAEVWSNGDVVINTAGKGMTPATKVILNLVLGVFKVEIAESERKSGGGDERKPKTWHIEHKSGYKQAFSENMNMSLFPNRDWSYMKTRLKRLPTKIFLPKEQHFLAPPADGDYVDEEQEEAEPQQRRRQPNLLPAAARPSQRQRCEPPPASNGYFHHDENVGGAASRVNDNDRPSWPGDEPSRPALGHGSEQDGAGEPLPPPPVGVGGNGDAVPSAAFAAAALKEGVPPHLIQRLMRAVGASGAADAAAMADDGGDAVVEDLFAAAGGGRGRVVGRRVSPVGEEFSSNGIGRGGDGGPGGPGGGGAGGGGASAVWSSTLPPSCSQQPPVPVVSEAVVSPPRGGYPHGYEGPRGEWEGGVGGAGAGAGGRRRSRSRGGGEEERGRFSSVPAHAEVWMPWKPGDDSLSPPPRSNQRRDDFRRFGRDHHGGRSGRTGGREEVDRRWDDGRGWASGRRGDDARQRAIVNDHRNNNGGRGGGGGFRGHGGSQGNAGGGGGGNRRNGQRYGPQASSLSSSYSRSPRRSTAPSPPSRRGGRPGADGEERRRRGFAGDAEAPRRQDDDGRRQRRRRRRDSSDYETERRQGGGDRNGADRGESDDSPGGTGLSVGGDGLERRDSSYDPDQFDPNAYDPGEVTVKRDAVTGKPKLTPAAAKQLVNAVRKAEGRRSASASRRSSSNASRSSDSLTRDDGSRRRRRRDTLSRSRSRSRSRSQATVGRRTSGDSKRGRGASKAGAGREASDRRRDTGFDYGTGKRERSLDRTRADGGGFTDDWRQHETVGYVTPASADVDVHLPTPPPTRGHSYDPGVPPPGGDQFHGSVEGSGAAFPEANVEAPRFAPRQQHEQQQHQVQQQHPPPPPAPQQQQQQQQVLLSPQPPAGQHFQNHPEPQMQPPPPQQQQQQGPAPAMHHPPPPPRRQQDFSHTQQPPLPLPPRHQHQQQQQPMQPQQGLQQQQPPHLVLLPHPPPTHFFLPGR